MSRREQLAAAAAAIVGKDRVSWSPEELATYSRDAWGLLRAHGDQLSLPELVVRPANTEQVAAMVRLAVEHRTPIVPYGGGTGIMG
ncbi:MAG TPA: FAD-binding protein, partial [Dehalococcoidia bacterium]|nr:FAD-binding protein [Dehalococcoidia bacterium]